MFRTDDPIADFNAYEDYKERQLKKRPKCGDCRKHIQEDGCYLIDGEPICEGCLEKNYYRFTEDFMEE